MKKAALRIVKPATDDIDRLAENDEVAQREKSECPTMTDSRWAEQLVKEHGDHLRYVEESHKWMAFDGKRFKLDGGAGIHQRAKATIRALHAKALEWPESERRTATIKAALAAESRQRRDAIVALAQHEPEVRVSANNLDADPWLLNVLNGTIDLKTGKLRQHRREDLITKLAPVDYSPSAKCPLFKRFLARILGNNRELIAFLQRAIGYSLTGCVNEQLLFFLHGDGQNGKSTFAGVLLDVLGDYGKQAAPDLLLAKKNESHPTEKADLLGARFVVTQEIEDGRRMDEVTVKQLTGGDRVKGRFMFKDFIEFNPTHKLWLCANHRPAVRGTDFAIWRRISLIPFTVIIPERERDSDLPEKLRTELPGILRWAVEGCLLWQQDGLKLPGVVRAASADYRSEQDLVGQFLTKWTVADPRSQASAAELYKTFKDHCEAVGVRPWSQKLFGTRLGGRPGLSKSNTRDGVVWGGLRLLDLSNPEGWGK